MAPSTVSSPPDAPTADQIRRFNARVSRLISQAATAEDDVLRSLRTQLVVAQRDARLLAVSTQGASGQIARITSRLDALEEVLAKITGTAVTSAATSGATLVDEAFDVAGFLLELDDVDLSGLITDKTSFAKGLITDRVDDLRARMVHQINRLATGTDVASVLADIGEELRGSAVFGAAARDVTAMAITSMGDAHGAGAIHRAQQIAGAGGPVTLKRWVSAHTKEARPGHVHLEATTVAGIPLDEPFHLGRYSAQRPRGPGLPGVERISCRCRLGLILSDEVPTLAAAGQAANDRLGDTVASLGGTK